MSYIRMDKALCRKPKFRRIARETGLADHELAGYLFLIWGVVDELGQDFEGTDEDIACAVCAPSALVCALCAAGWATRFEGGITFHSNDPTQEERTKAHRARAARSYERKKGDSAPVCAQNAQTAPPTSQSDLSIRPPSQSDQSAPSAEPPAEGPEEASPVGRGEIETEIQACPRKAFIFRTVIPKCRPRDQPKLIAAIAKWPRGEWIYAEYQRWKAGASKAKSEPAYWGACIKNAKKGRA